MSGKPHPEQWTRLGPLLQGFLIRHQISPAHIAAAQAEDACAELLRELFFEHRQKVRPLHFREGVMTIAVSDPMLAQEVRLRGLDIKAMLQKRLTMVELESVRVVGG